ncbi:MAG TPA: hypothetical protein VIL37_16765 [Natronosporangium sp.]
MAEPQPPVDPDPTPTASPWVEYLAAAQSLDLVRREAATAAATATQAASAVRAELDQVASQLELQRARLVAETVRAGLPPPQLDPTPSEQASAEALVGSEPATVAEALRHSQRLLESANAELVTGVSAAQAERGWWPPPLWVWVVAGLSTVAALACAIPLVLILFG